MKKIQLAAIPLLSATLFACGVSNDNKSSENDFTHAYQSITDATLKAHTKTLSSDEFEGRSPTSKGEQVTLDYLIRNFKEMGYQPGNGNSYLQAVNLLEMTASPDMAMTIGDNRFEYKKGMIASTKREQSQVSVTDSDVVFVGFGVNAPEYDWNDYAGLDVKGKTVVILVNDPGFENPDSGKFQGKTMTYYGRWTYKYEEASRQGAAAAIIVHETAPASYGWSVVANSWSGPQYSLVSDNGNADRVAIEGWLSNDAAKKVFADAGLDFAQEKAKALQGPYHKSLKQKASVTVNSTMKKSVSQNVIATLPGSETPDEHVIYSAHWDHLGKDESKDGDQIYNGAHDNATGTATALTIAKAFKELNVAPKRSVTFLIVTAEEQGLLGSLYYAEHPIIPLDKTIANLNMDAMNVLGRTKDVSVVGMGKSELETYLAKAASRQNRTLTQESRPEAGSYYRSDHFSFAKQGVPALYAKGGDTPIDEQTAAYKKRAKVVITGCYHQVCDQFRENWDFSGVREDSQLLFEVGYDIAQSTDWPKWSASSEFQRH
ncbi:MAG: M28 family metallopeptidase [Paraglaciecola polaris]|uniref:M28 family metallopeptidase n=1 Tax=Paraglaciecola polaris TaxID=222814 RepID=UPI003000FBC5|tara:strand:- start:14282 stop:15916 length:1635 start_codon:yes stop_codon:yes gene_type:complete